MNLRLLLYILTGLVMASCDGEDDSGPKSYLKPWIGRYLGTSHHWSSYPAEVNGQWQIISTKYDRNVLVDISFGEQDSCLSFIITYDDKIIDTKENLLFSNTGNHFSQWGGGSTYGFLNINLKNDSLQYHYFQKCGIPCNSGIDFDIKKHN